MYVSNSRSPSFLGCTDCSLGRPTRRLRGLGRPARRTLRYYGADVFPFGQGNGGPMAPFPGSPYLKNPPFPAGLAGLGRAPHRPVRPLGGMGDLFDPSTWFGQGATSLGTQMQGQVNQVAQQLAAAQQGIDQTNQILIQATQAGVNVAAEAQQNNQAQQQLQTAVSDYTLLYRTLFGAVPPGLSGLGQFDPATLTTIGGVAAALAVIAGILYTVNNLWGAAQTSAQAKLAQAQAQLQAQQNITGGQTQYVALTSQANAARAAGDSATYNSLMAQANALLASGTAAGVAATPPPPSSPGIGAWLSTNWMYVAGGTAAVFLLKDLL